VLHGNPLDVIMRFDVRAQSADHAAVIVDAPAATCSLGREGSVSCR